ncbi:VOC family protein [Sagittula salina]|uniref:VOC family protein n=1 Tax=Sagittula salina TaxID=2820268 RepID=A0A940MMC7_9RHOB|nr:VOC family protein [Sagittula salina]MBP0481118.1 VOC family protein [Sagittula salina]
MPPVSLTLDHIAVLGETLAEAVDHVEAALGHPMRPGGSHARFGTHNQLLGLSPDLYIEAIAIDPSAPGPGDARWFGLDTFQGAARLDKWVCAVDDVAAAIALLPMAGRLVELERNGLRWIMAVPEDGMLPFGGLFPALIQWKVPVPPGKALTPSDSTLEALVVTHPEAPALEALLAPVLDAPLVRFETGTAGLAAYVRQKGATVVLR